MKCLGHCGQIHQAKQLEATLSASSEIHYFLDLSEAVLNFSSMGMLWRKQHNIKSHIYYKVSYQCDLFFCGGTQTIKHEKHQLVIILIMGQGVGISNEHGKEHHTIA